MRLTMLSGPAAIALALAGCAGEGPPVAGAGSDPGAILSGLVPSPDVRTCIPTQPSRGLEVIDRSTVAYRAPGRVHISRLDGDCPGLTRTDPIRVETRGPRQICAGDFIRTIDGSTGLQLARCRIGPFQTFSRRAG